MGSCAHCAIILGYGGWQRGAESRVPRVKVPSNESDGLSSPLLFSPLVAGPSCVPFGAKSACRRAGRGPRARPPRGWQPATATSNNNNKNKSVAGVANVAQPRSLVRVQSTERALDCLCPAWGPCGLLQKYAPVRAWPPCRARRQRWRTARSKTPPNHSSSAVTHTAWRHGDVSTRANVAAIG